MTQKYFTLIFEPKNARVLKIGRICQREKLSLNFTINLFTMKKLIQEIRTLLASPDYEKAFLLWLEKLASDPAFMFESTPLKSDILFVKMLEMLGKSIFKKEKPHLDNVKLQEYKSDKLVHGFATVEGKLVVILFFYDIGMGVSALYAGPKQVIYSRLTSLAEAPVGNYFLQHGDKNIN